MAVFSVSQTENPIHELPSSELCKAYPPQDWHGGRLELDMAGEVLLWSIIHMLLLITDAYYSEILSLSALKNGNIDVRYSFVFNNTFKSYVRSARSGVRSRFNNNGDASVGLIELYSLSEVLWCWYMATDVMLLHIGTGDLSGDGQGKMEE